MNKFNLIDSVDWCDIISMNQFWIEDKDKNKKVVYPTNKIKDLIFYYDSNNLLRCFEKESLAYLKDNNIHNHPITKEKIPDYVFDNINIIIKKKKLTNNELALQVFQHFTKISIFIKYEKFMELTKDKLIKFNFELNDIWNKNLNEEQKKLIPNIVFRKNTQLNKLNIKTIQTYLLNIIDNMLKCEKEELKYMINYIILGVLSIFIPDIRRDYPDFIFSWE
jgi:hypothetical protein